MMGDSLVMQSASAGGGVERSLTPRPTTRRADVADLDALRAEVDRYYVRVRDLGTLESSEIFMDLAAITGRLSEMRKDVYRQTGRLYTAFRTQEIDPLLEECDRQFKFFSRAFSAVELDARIATSGRVT